MIFHFLMEELSIREILSQLYILIREKQREIEGVLEDFINIWKLLTNIFIHPSFI